MLALQVVRADDAGCHAWTLESTGGPSPRYGQAMAYDAARGRVVLFGGSSGLSGELADTWEWDGANWTLVNAPGPWPRLVHTMAYDAARARIVLFGGWDGARLGGGRLSAQRSLALRVLMVAP
jgi:hypothetical protein